MKMSLCNTFRLFVSLIIVLSSIDTLAFTLHRPNGDQLSRDLAQEESVVVEIKNEIKGPNNTQMTLGNNGQLKLNTPKQISRTSIEIQGHDNNKNEEATGLDGLNRTTATESQISSSNPINPEQVINNEPTIEAMTISAIRNAVIDANKQITSSLYDDDPKIITNNTRQNEFIQPESMTLALISNQKITESSLKNGGPEIATSFESAKLPIWKKYTTIDRKRQPTTITDDNTIPNNKTEEMTNAETKRLRVSLQDTVTSDIPSLEQLKNDLLYSTVKEQVSEIKSRSHKSGSKEINTSTEITSPISISTSEDSPTSSTWGTFESKRAGYLDLSGKIINEHTLPLKELSEFDMNPKEGIRAMFEDGNAETDIAEEKIELNKAESQSQLNEDAIKEELLKEKFMNENVENVKKFDLNIQLSPETQNTNSASTQMNSSNELSVKPITGEKGKNTSLYTVNPNYKPLKKLEVQAPKQFVRDPDDNSWRNESLSSLGIVFKPKNSSKPFTQVLKNKTETEWNSLSEKDSKNDIPDLKERLQKMAEKRKSKRKKTDSFGNIVYFDYEENSSSGEHVSKDQSLSTVTTSAESPTSINNSSEESSTNINHISSISSEAPSDITTPLVSTTEKTRGKIRDSYSTRKFRKFFNVPEYYDSTDEDDTDYLNMAKIDIKKFSTSPKTTVPTTTTPATLRPWTINKVSHTISPERKATIQYFPPLTTQRVNINDYDNDFKIKVNSFTTPTEPPKTILPASLDKPTTPDDIPEFKTLNNDRVNTLVVTNKPDFAKNYYSTQPPQTTQTEFTLLNDDGTFDRDSYVIRHYKDFINEAAKDNEFDKNMDYIPYTEAPARDDTKTELVKYVTEKAKTNMDNEFDYETQFRKDVLQRFVDNFNQNSERFKAEFPILFNNSIVHRDTHGGGDIASSRAFMRGLYNTDLKTKTPHREAYDPNNENITVELSPSYELHYYMPEQEEKEEAVPQPVTLPYQYRL